MQTSQEARAYLQAMRLTRLLNQATFASTLLACHLPVSSTQARVGRPRVGRLRRKLIRTNNIEHGRRGAEPAPFRWL